MGNRKPQKKTPPRKPKPKLPSTASLQSDPTSVPDQISNLSSGAPGLAVEILDPPSPTDTQPTASATVLATNKVSDLDVVAKASEVEMEESVQVVTQPEPVSTANEQEISPARISNTPTVNATLVANPDVANIAATAVPNAWVDKVKGSSKQLKRKGTAFTLETGEACVRIPNSVIERSKKSWECFIIGQFYYDPPSQGIIHNIVNGIWSKHFRDIAVSKMEGNTFLFRIPNAQTRSRVLSQRLWQIAGQTMFVAKWDPGVVPVKPELSSAPIWLELRNVPLQFFNEESLEHIAGLVGDPKLLHPSTANKTNLEVAKVFTIIDPRKPLPEAVNVQFDSGEIRRVLVSSPWMPLICAHCKEIGHSLKYCKNAPITCNTWIVVLVYTRLS